VDPYKLHFWIAMKEKLWLDKLIQPIKIKLLSSTDFEGNLNWIIGFCAPWPKAGEH
jgi:hypothetical protein